MVRSHIGTTLDVLHEGMDSTVKSEYDHVE